jgi:hypothetical protein
VPEDARILGKDGVTRYQYCIINADYTDMLQRAVRYYKNPKHEMTEHKWGSSSFLGTVDKKDETDKYKVLEGTVIAYYAFVDRVGYMTMGKVTRFTMEPRVYEPPPTKP